MAPQTSTISTGRRLARALVFLAAISLWTIAVWSSRSSISAHQEAAPASNGVYTEAQAKRGEAIYRQECVTCHADEGAGAESAPAIVGEQFLERWKGKTVGQLFDKIRVDMPADAPGRLGNQANADVTAYTLRLNEFPAGDQELLGDKAASNATPLNAQK